MLKLVIPVVAALATFGSIEGYNRVCYHTNWSQYRPGTAKFMPENIDPSLCTHLIYSFAKMNDQHHLHAFEWNDDSTAWSKGMYERFNELKQKNPNLKTLLAVGGWNMGSDPFTKMVASDASIQSFADDAVNFLRSRDFDGLDMDWEYPGNRGSPPADKARFTKLLQMLLKTFEKEAAQTGRPRLLLTAAVAAGQGTANKAYDIPALGRCLDMINLMTYDFHGGSFDTVTGHNAPMTAASTEPQDFSVTAAVDYWLNGGIPPQKLMLGMPLYGRSFKLQNNNIHGIGAPGAGAGTAGKYTREAGFLAYYEICDVIKNGGTVERLPGLEPYVYRNDQWIGYDDTKSLEEKTKYAMQKHLGGIMVWALDLDDFNGDHCSSGRYPLLKAINAQLINGVNGGPVLTNAPPMTTQPSQTQRPGMTSVPAQTPAPTQAPTNHPTVSPQKTTTTKVPQTTTHHVGSTNRFDCSGKSPGFYADQSNCDVYFICAGTQSFEVACASGLLFNPSTKYCDWPRNVNCGSNQGTGSPATQPPVFTTRPHVTTSPTPQWTYGPTQPPPTYNPSIGAAANTFCSSKSDGHYRDPSDCGFFYQCASSLGFHEPCPPGLAFNEAITACDYPLNVPVCSGYKGRK